MAFSGLNNKNHSGHNRNGFYYEELLNNRQQMLFYLLQQSSKAGIMKQVSLKIGR